MLLPVCNFRRGTVLGPLSHSLGRPDARASSGAIIMDKTSLCPLRPER